MPRTARLTAVKTLSPCSSWVPATSSAAARRLICTDNQAAIARWPRRSNKTRPTKTRVASAAISRPFSKRDSSRLSRVSAITCSSWNLAAAAVSSSVFVPAASTSSGVRNSAISPSIIRMRPCGSFCTVTTPAPTRASTSFI